MIEIMYNPSDVGVEILNNRKRVVKIRKYHMDPTEKEQAKVKWLEDISSLPPVLVKRLRDRAGKYFFNPYRRGIYYNQIQVLFLLGCNRWHCFPKVLSKIGSYMSEIGSSDSRFSNSWDKYRGKSVRDRSFKCKDYQGRIKENFIFFQRLSRLHPYGYKLRQVKAAIDIKRIDEKGISNGVYFYRLSTYSSISDAFPLRDYRGYTFPMHERKYVSYKFLGTIMTKNKTIVKGVEV
jgi:hypothetical protein